MNIIISILLGALIGWIAGIVMKSSHGFWMSCLLGIVGGALGSFLAGLIGIGTNSMLGSIIVGVIGTCILIAIVRAIMGKRF